MNEEPILVTTDGRDEGWLPRESVWVAIEHNSGGADVVGVFSSKAGADGYVAGVAAKHKLTEAQVEAIRYPVDSPERTKLLRENAVKASTFECVAKSDASETWSRGDRTLSVTIREMTVQP